MTTLDVKKPNCPRCGKPMRLTSFSADIKKGLSDVRCNYYCSDYGNLNVSTIVQGVFLSQFVEGND